MTKLVIKGHNSRGKEVIEILKMLSGNTDTPKQFVGNLILYGYYINSCGSINFKHSSEFDYDNDIIYSLEEFLEKFPYKVGDKAFAFGNKCTVIGAVWDGNMKEVVYTISLDTSEYITTKLSNQLQPYKKQEPMEERENVIVVNHEHKQLKIHSLSYDKVQLMIDDKYELKQEGNTFYIIKKEAKYPKTYKECCDVLGIKTMDNDAQGYKAYLIINLQELIIARDAYWKIAGEQMGLCKPWTPDWEDENEIYYTISYDGVNIKCYNNTDVYSKLAFPTTEMRDAFCENFKDLIERCKTFL